MRTIHNVYAVTFGPLTHTQRLSDGAHPAAALGQISPTFFVIVNNSVACPSPHHTPHHTTAHAYTHTHTRTHTRQPPHGEGKSVARVAKNITTNQSNTKKTTYV